MTTNQPTQEIQDVIARYAREFKIQPQLILAICTVENEPYDPYAARFEKNYKWLYMPEKFTNSNNSIDTEIAFQMTSWGLMQVMGAVFREYGYTGRLNHIPISDQIFFGVRHLSVQMRKHGEKPGIIAYNTGFPGKDESGEYEGINYYLKVVHAMT